MMRSGGLVSITLSDSLKDKNVKTDRSGMFKDVQVGRGRPARPPENGPNWDALNRALFRDQLSLRSSAPERRFFFGLATGGRLGAHHRVRGQRYKIGFR